MTWKGVGGDLEAKPRGNLARECLFRPQHPINGPQGGAVKASPRLPAVVATGDRRASLEALRDHLAVALVEVDARYKAPVAKQLTDTIREIDGLADAKARSPLDDLVARRAARASAS